MSTDIESAFVEFRGEIATDTDLKEAIRDIVRDLEEKGRDMLALMQKAHPPVDTQQLLTKVHSCLTDVRTLYETLASKVPNKQYYKYHDQFRFVNQRMSFLVSFLVFLESGDLATRHKVAQQLGISYQRDAGLGFHLDLEDYLHGLLQLSSELSRFTVNCVTQGDYGKPFRIHAFLVQLDAGFRLLNLKNDNLRKKFDALKYDVQKVEHVVYDLTIRGLKPVSDQAQVEGQGQDKKEVAAKE